MMKYNKKGEIEPTLIRILIGAGFFIVMAAGIYVVASGQIVELWDKLFGWLR